MNVRKSLKDTFCGCVAIDNRKVIYPCFFCIHFFRQRVNIAFQRALVSIIGRKITQVDACFGPSIFIRSHDLHACGIRGAVGEIASYHKKDQFSPFFLVPTGCLSFGLSLAFPFCLPYDGSSHQSFIKFFVECCVATNLKSTNDHVKSHFICIWFTYQSLYGHL